MTTVTGEKPVTAKFDSSGALSGSGGCNQYSATYKVNRNQHFDYTAHNNPDGLSGTDYATGNNVSFSAYESIQL